MKIKDMRKKSRKELETTLDTLRNDIATLSREKYIKDETNRNKIRNMRHDIARVKTILRENELSANAKAQESKEA